MRKKGLVFCLAACLILCVVIFSGRKTDEQLMIIENSKLFSEKIEQICTSEGVSFFLYEATPFEWDSVYFCSNYATSRMLYEVAGYKWDKVTFSGAEGSTGILFMYKDKVVCFVEGSVWLSRDLNYYFHIVSTDINRKIIDYSEYPKFEVESFYDMSDGWSIPSIKWIGNFPGLAVK